MDYVFALAHDFGGQAEAKLAGSSPLRFSVETRRGRGSNFNNIVDYVLYAEVAELVDATDLKFVGLSARAGSIPALGTK